MCDSKVIRPKFEIGMSKMQDVKRLQELAEVGASGILSLSRFKSDGQGVSECQEIRSVTVYPHWQGCSDWSNMPSDDGQCDV